MSKAKKYHLTPMRFRMLLEVCARHHARVHGRRQPRGLGKVTYGRRMRTLMSLEDAGLIVGHDYDEAVPTQRGLHEAGGFVLRLTRRLRWATVLERAIFDFCKYAVESMPCSAEAAQPETKQ